jgi:hypothetical protein
MDHPRQRPDTDLTGTGRDKGDGGSTVTEYQFIREARTAHSEAYAIEDGEHSLGRVDVHYTTSVAYATLAVHHSLDDEAVQALIAAIDARIVSSADPHREDFIVTVWKGEEAGTYADDSDFAESDYEDDEAPGAADWDAEDEDEKDGGA